MSKAIYEFHWDCGRMGHVTGLFVADSEDVADACGEEVHFGEILGKHSDVYGTLEQGDFEVKSEDPDFVAAFIDIMGGGTISGHNPLDYLDEDR